MPRAPPTDRMEDIGTAPDDNDGAEDDTEAERPPPTERMEDIGTAPDDGSGSGGDPEPDPTNQPARGRDRDSGDGRGSGGTGGVNESEPTPEPEPDPTDQPARGADRDSGDGMGSGTTQPEPDPEPTDSPEEGTSVNDPINGDGTDTQTGGQEEITPEPPEPEQGLEAEAKAGQVAAVNFEEEFLRENPQFDAEDVRVVSSGENEIALELTSTGREIATARELGLGEEDIAITGSGEVVPTSEAGEDELGIRGIEQEIEDRFPDAQSYSIDAGEGDTFAVEVTTNEGETEQFAVGEDITPPANQDLATSRRMDRMVGEFNRRSSARRSEFGLEEAREDATENILSQIESETGAELDETDVTVERVTEDGETRFQGQLTESGQRKVGIATRQIAEGGAAFREATESGGFLTEEREANLADRSAEFQESVEGISEGVVDFFDTGFEAEQDVFNVGEEGLSAGQRARGGIISGTLGFLDPFQAVKTGETATEIAQSVAKGEVEFEEFAASTKAVAAYTGTEVAEAFKESPQQVGGQLLGSAGGGVAVGAASPLRFSKIKIPDTEGGTQTIRTAQLGFPGGTRKTLTPGAKQLKTRPTKFQTPTKNIAGARGFKPTIGTPKADIDAVDFTRLGTRADDAFEPTGQLETQVFRKSFEARGEATTAQRIGAVRDLMKSGKKSRSAASLEITSAEDIARRVEGVPEGEAGRVAAKLQETDASIFGSAATEAQLPGFRQGVLERPAPKDIDVTVPDEAAKAELEAFESEVGADIFDIKLEEKVPGRAAGGQPIKFGQRSQSMLETEEGVPVNPASEELLRKAGASGFFRGTDAPEVGEFDIGPQPVRPGRLSTRQKDVLDAVAMGEELLGPEAKSVRQFRSAFEDVEGVGPTQGAITLRDRLQINRFLDDTRGQTGVGATRGTREVDFDTGDADDIIRRFDDADDTGASPLRTADIETTSPSAFASSGVGAAGSQVSIGSPGASPASERFTSPTTGLLADPSMGSPAGLAKDTATSGIGGSDFDSPVSAAAVFDPSPITMDMPTVTSPTGGSPGSPTSSGGPGGSPGTTGGTPPFEGGPVKPQKRPDDDDMTERDDPTMSPGEFTEQFETKVATPEQVLEANFGGSILDDGE